MGDDDAPLVKATLTAQDETGSFTNIRAVQGDTGYNLKVSLDQVDSTTNSIKCIDYAHAELHTGTHYMVRDFVSLAKNGSKNFLFVSPDTLKWDHTTIGFEAISSKVTVHLYEEPTVTTIGTPLNKRNRNRNYSNGSTLLIYEDTVVSANGTQLAAYVIGSGKNAGGGARDNEEIILRQNTQYLVTIQEANVVATEVNYTFDWYEHTNK